MRGRTFDFSQQVAVMAIVNRTPDSFYDQGRTFALDAAVAAVRDAVATGADWVDIGGQPFAPGPEIPVAGELDRVLPVVEAAPDSTDAVISVGTYRPYIAARTTYARQNADDD